MKLIPRLIAAAAQMLRVTVLGAMLMVWAGLSATAQDSICARVKIEILQELTLERQAFEARMTINNGLAGISLDQILVDINFADRNGNAVRATTNPNDTSAKFFWRLQTGSSIPTSIAGGTSNRITWLIIPSPGAAGPKPQGELYFVGATLRYKVAGESQEVQVSPDSILVKPMPILSLDYFLPNEVYGDEPFTTTFVEPPVPFNLGVRVRNLGYGTAYKLKIESAQPKIVENELGLAVDFHIEGSEVNGNPATSTLLADFGDIAPNRAGVARWIMICTLSGRFVEFTANYTHADDLGGQVTSLITNTPRTHFLVHDVLVDLPGRDGVRDFLALDLEGMRVYESDGADNVVLNQSATASLTGSGDTRILNSGPTAALSYIKLSDPFQGVKNLQSARRADGKAIHPANAWLSKAFDRNAKRWDYFVNLFDINNVSGLGYTLQFTTSAGYSNRPPVLDPISNWTINPGDTLSFPVTAYDPDFDRLEYTFVGTNAAGATLDRISGQFQWRPTDAQANSTNTFTVRVTDNGNPPLSNTTSFVVIVRPINRPPVVGSIPNKTVDEGTPLAFTVSATDPDGPGQTLSYFLAPGSPIGAQINATNGVFTWTPNEAQGPTTNVVTIIASDSGTPSKFGTNTVRIVVNEVNTPPTLVAVPPQTANVLTSLRVTNRVVDPDIPANRMSFTLGLGGPVGARINPTNGVFSWTPQRNDNFSTNSFNVQVSDNGQPPYTANGSFLVYVNDFLELTLGQSVVRIQETGRVSVTLYSRNGLTNLSFAVAMPTNRLANPRLESLAPNVGAASLEPIPPWLLVNISARNGQTLQGTQQIAALTFTALSNRSAFVPVPLTNVTARRSAGTSVSQAIANDGRVVVIGAEPLLEARLPAARREVTLYGNPGKSYMVESSTNLNGGGDWRPVQVLNLFDNLEASLTVPGSLPQAFYRAYEIVGAQGALAAYLVGSNMAIEWAAQSATGCRIEQTTSLVSPIWSPTNLPVEQVGTRLRILVPVTSGTTGTRFFRLSCP